MPWIKHLHGTKLTRRAAISAVVVFVFFLVQPGRAAEQNKDATVKAAAKAAVVTPEQCRDWAVALQRAIARKDVASFNRLIDWNAIFEKATEWPDPTPTVRNNRAKFILGLKDTVDSGQGMLGELLKTWQQGGSYHFLGCREVAGSREARFRMLLPSKGINYHFLRLAVAEDGSVRAVDWYIFLLGQWQSETLRQAFLPLANTWAKGGAHLIAPAEGQFVTHFHDIQAMVESYQKKDFEQVLQVYRGLPESVQRHKMPFALRLGAAQALHGDAQRQALDDFRKFYPNDAAVDLIVFDDLVAHKSFDKALAGIDRIDKAVGGDPHLKVVRAQVLQKQGKRAEALKMVEAAIAEEPTLKGAYYFLTHRALQAKDFAKTAELLTTLETKCGVKFKDLTKVPAYREFVKSPEYETWLKSHHQGG
jgi:hypothetical protein